MIHRNSRASYRRLEEFTIPERQGLILGMFIRYGPMTDKEVRERLGYRDMNAVRPRITELLKKGWLVESGTIYDIDTERHVRLVKYVGNGA